MAAINLPEDVIEQYKRELEYEIEAWGSLIKKDDNPETSLRDPGLSQFRQSIDTPEINWEDANNRESRSLARIARHAAVAFGDLVDRTATSYTIEFEFRGEEYVTVSPFGCYDPGKVEITYKLDNQDGSSRVKVSSEGFPYLDRPPISTDLEYENGNVLFYEPGDWEGALRSLYSPTKAAISDIDTDLNSLEQELYEREGKPFG